MLYRKSKTQLSLPIEVVGIQEDGFHLFVDVKVNGKPVRLLLDSGASRTVFDISILKKIHSEIELEVNEDKATGLGCRDVESFIAFIEKLELGEIEVLHYQTGALDLSHVNESYSHMGFREIGGVLGSDLLMKFNAVIDYKRRRLLLEK